MFTGFTAEYKKTYKIIRDYYVSTESAQGIYFIAEDKESGELREFFLPRGQMNNIYLPIKTKEKDIRYKMAGIETGNESVIIIETGVLEKTKKIGNDVNKIAAKKYRYVFKEK